MRDSKLIVGLMSGTSLDGVDAALVQIHRAGEESAVELKRFVSLPYPRDVRDALLRVASGRPVPAGVISQLSVLLGGLYAQAVKEVCQASRVSLGQLDLIGSHGQTIYHQSDPSDLCGYQIASTYQIGEAAVLVEETGVTTVSDFRPNDMAAGGTGAPLIPLVDFLLFREPKLGRVLLNLGGIANLTVLPPAAELDEIQAFDSGPGNMVIDALVRRLIGGKEGFDSEGGIASSGKPMALLLEALLADPYFSRPPPKSAGREQFGEEFVERILAVAGTSSTADLICTATELTARTVSDAVIRCAADATRLDQVAVSGGGVHNAYLMRRLKESLPHIDVIAADELGIPADAKEAVGFAVLANETFELAAGNVPAATGARRRVVLGKVTYGQNYGALRGYS
ncbi:MAG: anhydro-N-acetylmuramic acid kinase [Chloroflexi bacterium]|nr:anhydro-N-acetylmuramic acid kinase [Chloroflexota bacterium]MCY3938513.1 anhydro-N-acetylmuramic acid kinase [Chloroflexota bacterium]